MRHALHVCVLLVLVAGGAVACSEAQPRPDPGPENEGGAGGDSGCPADPCEGHSNHEACCADPGCGWHHNTGHSQHGIPSCVAKDRVCIVAGEEVRACNEGMTCIGEGVFQDTEDDCELPPGGSISLLDRGICACTEP